MTDALAISPLQDRFDASLRLPGSKSLTNRALLLAALAGGKSRLSNILQADDTRVMLDALRALGFQLSFDASTCEAVIEGADGHVSAHKADLSLGNAGTAVRFLTAACCLGEGEYTIDGIPRMRQRPIGQLVDPLLKLGANVTYLGEDGYPPLRVRGRGGLRGGTIALGPTLSSQFISALLQIGPGCEEGVTLRFDQPIISEPYVRMTCRLMQRFGVEVQIREEGGERTYAVAPGSRYTGCDYAIEPDASNASYFLAAAAISPRSRCTIEGLGENSLQGDAGFACVLEQMGASVRYTPDSITVEGPDQLHGVDIDLNAMPDTAQTLAVVALFADGPTVIRNVGNLRVKETDRLAALEAELAKLGANAHIKGDDLHVHMPTPGRLRPAEIATYDDHRMAMSFAVAGLRSEGVSILDPACVEKSFPQFFDYLSRLGSPTVTPMRTERPQP